MGRGRQGRERREGESPPSGGQQLGLSPDTATFGQQEETSSCILACPSPQGRTLTHLCGWQTGSPLHWAHCCCCQETPGGAGETPTPPLGRHDPGRTSCSSPPPHSAAPATGSPCREDGGAEEACVNGGRPERCPGFLQPFALARVGGENSLKSAQPCPRLLSGNTTAKTRPLQLEGRPMPP